MTQLVVALLVITSVLGLGAGGTARGAAILPALPATVRVNIAGLGTSYAVISSTGTMTATAQDATVLYRGGGRTVSRTNVRKVTGTDLVLPPRQAGTLTPAERADRSGELRSARVAQADSGPRSLITIPFQFSVLQGPNDDIGAQAVTAERPMLIRFTTDDGILQYNGHFYRGVLELALDDENDLIVVNTVQTHDYLASVVGSEVPSSWETEALAAQAVAARTYLYTHLGRHRSYDLEGDTRDQEYDGTQNEDARTVRAVERTAGQIATFGGAPIDALYSANAGGLTEDSENVFANALPYLRSVPSPGDAVAQESSWGKTSYEWTKEISATQLRDYLVVRGFNVGVPREITFTGVSPTGRVLAVRVVGSDGTKDIGKDRARYYFGLRSSLFTVSAAQRGATERVNADDLERQKTLAGLGAQQTATAFEILRDAAGSEVGLRATSYIYELPATFVFKGKGFGHGVGMSQWGAQGMALKGSSAEQILAYYYRGTTVTAVGGD
ncbi:MAG: hypothetical protein NVS9B6_04920 [Candidatus Limnocylindrales bacterium]